jgi:hypothetical protein
MPQAKTAVVSITASKIPILTTAHRLTRNKHVCYCNYIFM